MHGADIVAVDAPEVTLMVPKLLSVLAVARSDIHSRRYFECGVGMRLLWLVSVFRASEGVHYNADIAGAHSMHSLTCEQGRAQ